MFVHLFEVKGRSKEAIHPAHCSFVVTYQIFSSIISFYSFKNLEFLDSMISETTVLYCLICVWFAVIGQDYNILNCKCTCIYSKFCLVMQCAFAA